MGPVIPDGLIQCAPGANRDSLSHSAVRHPADENGCVISRPGRAALSARDAGCRAEKSNLGYRVARRGSPHHTCGRHTAGQGQCRSAEAGHRHADSRFLGRALGTGSRECSAALPRNDSSRCGAAISSQGAHHLHTRFRESVSVHRFTLLVAADGAQGLVEVGDQVGGVFNPQRHAEKAVANAGDRGGGLRKRRASVQASPADGLDRHVRFSSTLTHHPFEIFALCVSRPGSNEYEDSGRITANQSACDAGQR
jgi:hypothetical protein